MKIIVPMAGRGSRFQTAVDRNPEYKKPKPLIEIKGKPMIEWAMESLPFLDLPKRKATTPIKVPMSNLIFISLEEQQKQYHIVDLLQKVFGTQMKVVLIPQVTRGALETALTVKKYINTDDDILITDSDHYFDGMSLYKMIQKKDSTVQGMIPVFRPPDEEIKWSYTLFDKKATALAVGEKDPILAGQGAYANIGAYYFSYGNVFVTEAEEMIASNEMHGPEGKKEFFIAPLYQRMIKKGMKIQAAVVDWMWGLGTPKDVEYFEKHYKG